MYSNRTCYPSYHVPHARSYTVSLTELLRLPNYFNNWSVRPRPRCWMYLPMKINWKNFWLNVLFWGLVLLQKIPFDYFVIHKPVVKPVRQYGGQRHQQ